MEEDKVTRACQKINSKVSNYKPGSSNTTEYHITEYKTSPFELPDIRNGKICVIRECECKRLSISICIPDARC